MTRTRADNVPGNYADDAAASLFTSVIFDDGPDINSQPSRLWTSRDELQAASISQSQAPQPPEGVGIANTILDSIGRLQSSQNTHPAAFLLIPKKEKHRATQAAHHVLDTIESRAKHCQDQLDDMSVPLSHEAFRTVHVEHQRLQSALKKVKRDVLSVNERRDTIGALVRNIKERLNHWEELNPAHSLHQQLDEPLEQPFEYDSSAYIFIGE